MAERVTYLSRRLGHPIGCRGRVVCDACGEVIERNDRYVLEIAHRKGVGYESIRRLCQACDPRGVTQPKE